MLAQADLLDKADLDIAANESQRIWKECVADVKNLTGSLSVRGYHRQRLLGEERSGAV